MLAMIGVNLQRPMRCIPWNRKRNDYVIMSPVYICLLVSTSAVFIVIIMNVIRSMVTLSRQLCSESYHAQGLSSNHYVSYNT